MPPRRSHRFALFFQAWTGQMRPREGTPLCSSYTNFNIIQQTLVEGTVPAGLAMGGPIERHEAIPSEEHQSGQRPDRWRVLQQRPGPVQLPAKIPQSFAGLINWNFLQNAQFNKTLFATSLARPNCFSQGP